MNIRDIRFWIVVFLLMRLPGITQAPLDHGHAWRQSLTNMVSKHYAESEKIDVLRPRTNIIDKKSNIIASEFPAFNLVHAGLSKLFGYRHWYGRMVNLMLSSLAIWLFYLFLRRMVKDEQAFVASVLLMSSIWFSFSRKLMPDVWSVSLIIIGLYLVTEWVVRFPGGVWRLFLGIIAIGIGALSKLPAVLSLTLLFLPMMHYRHLFRKWLISGLLIAVVLTPALWWYLNWAPGLVLEGAQQVYFPYHFKLGWEAMIPYWKDGLEKFYFSAMQSFAGFIFFLVGLVILIWKKEHAYIFLFITGLLVLLFFAVKTGEVFPTHNYYIIPFVPLMCLIASIGLNIVQQIQWKIALVVLVVGEGLLNQAYDLVIPEDRMALLQAEEVLKRVVPSGDTIAVYSEGSPVLAYFAAYPCVRAGERELNGRPMLHQEHLSYWLALRSEIDEHKVKLPVSYQNEHFIIYRLRD